MKFLAGTEGAHAAFMENKPSDMENRPRILRAGRERRQRLHASGARLRKTGRVRVARRDPIRRRRLETMPV